MNKKTTEFGFHDLKNYVYADLRGCDLPWPSALVPVDTCSILFVLHTCNSSHYTQPQSIMISQCGMYFTLS